MRIKDRLALHFMLVSMGMLLVVLCSVYFIFLKFLEADFYDRLTDRTKVTAKLYLEADEISRDALNKVRSQYLEKLSDEVIRIYDANNEATFIGDRAQYWTSQTINKVRSLGKTKFKDGRNQVVGIFYKDNQGDFVILAAATDHSSHKRLSKLLKIMVFTFIMFSAILLVSGRWMAKKILRPLWFFMDEVKKVGSSNLEYRVTETNNKDEISELAKNFNRLMEELEQAFILQKTFVSNASHELRTPVTAIMMSAELALSKDRQASVYQDVLQSILEDTGKMNNIITGLLTLAKVDLELANVHLSTLNLSEILLAIKADWQKKHQLEILTNEDHSPSFVSANKILLLIALNNIISNAFKFSDDQPVSCRLEHHNHQVILHISDQGPGINESDLNSIFKPFFSRAAAQGKDGEGMGLYMAAKIIHLFKGEIRVVVQAVGATFSISLPRI